jgi:predicted secreted protein
MFDDNRSKSIIVVAHCLLNQNSISDGTADFPGQFRELIDLILANGIGLIQLPCPEVTCLGLDRKDKLGGTRPLLEENSRIRNLLSEPACVERLRSKAEEVASHIQEYESYGFKIWGVIGVNRSPSCGVETTSRDGHEVEGQGVFIELIAEALRGRGQTMKMIGVKTSQGEEAVQKLRQLIEESNKT